jgi:DNA invertase Pin-like site-specific DNA recombinase
MNNRQPVFVSGDTLLYSRLSKEDMLSGESQSIQNQQEILETYAAQNGFTNVRHFSDDGTTGTRFDREGWQQLIAEVEAGKVGAIIVKDVSRLGREHIQVGMYIEMFRQKGIRFIAITNNADSKYPETMEFLPFLNIFSEWYARDTSRKVKAVLHSKGNSGRHMTNSAVYGYRKSPEDKHKWLIDEEAAAVVRRIFAMTVEGKGPYQIARTLTDEKIVRPSVYVALRDGGTYTPESAAEPTTWGGATVTNILSRPEYMGSTVNFRTYKDSYKDKKHLRRPKEEWVVFEGTQEPIVDAETWHMAQKCRVVKRRANSTGEPNPLTGLVYCADCGGRMHNHRGTMADKYDSQDSYACNKYSQYPPKCTMHYVKTSALRSLVLDAIRKVSAYARENEAEFVRRVREDAEVQSAEAAKSQKKQLAKMQKRHKDLNAIIKQLFEDKAGGSLTQKRFDILSREYEDEQENLEKQIAELQAGLDRFSEDGERAEKFMGLVRRYKDFSELSASLLNEFVQKILVHEAGRINGQRDQTVDVYLNFIGKFEVPGQAEDTEAGPFDPVEHRRAQWRARYHKNREAILAKKAEDREREKAAKLAAEPQKSPAELAAEEDARRARKRAYQREYQREWQRKRRAQANGHPIDALEPLPPAVNA